MASLILDASSEMGKVLMFVFGPYLISVVEIRGLVSTEITGWSLPQIVGVSWYSHCTLKLAIMQFNSSKSIFKHPLLQTATLPFQSNVHTRFP